MKKQNTWWLISFWTFFLVGVLDNILTFLIIIKSSVLETGLQIAIVLGFLGVGLIIKIYCGWATYYFAYKKRGTKWLKILLFAIPIFFIRALSKAGLDLNDESYLSPLLVLLSLSLNIWFWLACYRLRQDNLRLKKAGYLAESFYPEQGLISKLRNLMTIR